MSEQIWWYTARASGIVALGLAALAVLWGLLFSTRLLQGKPSPQWLLDLHRFLGGLAVAFTAVHLTALMADSYVNFTLLDFLIPFASDWQPLPVAYGVVGMYLLVAVQGTSLMMKRLPRRVWKWVHLTSYGMLWTGLIHGLTAGTDAAHPLYVIGTTLVVGATVWLTAFRIVTRRKLRPRRTSRSEEQVPAIAS